MSKRRHSRDTTRALDRLAPALAGLAVGCLLASLVAAVAALAVDRPSSFNEHAVFEATHLPPLIRLAAEPVRLVYEVQCALEGEDDPEDACAIGGVVRIRSGPRDAFREFPLAPTSSAGLRGLVATVPAALAQNRDG